MIMAGLELMGEIPFHDVIIHSTILAPDGRRMSKSLGTGIDPVGIIEEHGADATRYGLLKMSSGQDVRWSIGTVEEGRKLANKLWNASRLLLANGGDTGRRAAVVARGALDPRAHRRDARRGRARLRRVRLLARRRPALPPHVRRLLRLVPRVDQAAASASPTCKATALAALERLLKLLHPVMPHVTEEIWSYLPARASRLIVAPWPEPDDAYAADGDALDRVQEAAERFRRSGVATPLDGDEQRIFAAVVRPERAKSNGGNLDAEIARLEQEIARAEQMLSNESFTGARARARRRRRAREARALPARA